MHCASSSSPRKAADGSAARRMGRPDDQVGGAGGHRLGRRGHADLIAPGLATGRGCRARRSSRPARSAARTRATSCGEHTTPPSPARDGLPALPLDLGREVDLARVPPPAHRPAWSCDVSTVTPTSPMRPPAALAAASIIAAPPSVWTVAIATPSAARAATASATVFGMSCHLRSRKTRSPRSVSTPNEVGALTGHEDRSDLHPPRLRQPVQQPQRLRATRQVQRDDHLSHPHAPDLE